jgi:hypothetical protein
VELNVIQYSLIPNNIQTTLLAFLAIIGASYGNIEVSAHVRKLIGAV